MNELDSPDILYVGFLTGHGGDANQMLLAAHGAQLSGARVKIIVPELPTSIEFAERCAELGIECERTSQISAGQNGPRQRPLATVRLIRRLRGRVIHFHTGNSSLPRMVETALVLLTRQRVFVTIQSPYETFEVRSSQARIWAAAARRRVHAVVSPSDHGTEFQRSCGIPDERAVTIRNSIDVEAMRSGDAAKARTELGMAADDPLVVFTSRLDPQKRPEEVVQIFHGVAEAHPMARLAIVGNGEDAEKVERLVRELGLQDRVHLLGFRTDIVDWLAAATVWLLPTERENFSVAVLEALAAGCAVLSTPCRGNDEILEHGSNALIFDIGDVATASEQLAQLLGDESLRAELGSQGSVDASQFTAEAMTTEYLDLYRRLAGVDLTSGDQPASVEKSASA